MTPEEKRKALNEMFVALVASEDFVEFDSVHREEITLCYIDLLNQIEASK